MSARAVDTVPRKAGRIPRWALKVGVVLCVIGVILAVAYFARSRLLGPPLVARVAAVVREATGLELEVGRLGGNWWSTLELTDVRLAGGEPTTVLRSVTIEHVSARFSLWRLVQGDERSVASVEVDGAVVLLDLERPARPPRREKDPEPFPWPETLPYLRAGDVDLELRLGKGRSLEVEGASVESAGVATTGEVLLDVRADRFAFEDPRLGLREAGLATRVHYRAGELEAPEIVFDGRIYGRQVSVDLRGLRREAYRFGGLVDAFGGTLELRAGVGDGVLRTWVAADGVRLGELLAELRVDSGVAGTAHLHGVWSMPLASPIDWSAHAWGRVEELAFLGRQFDLGTFTGSVDCGRVDFSEVTLYRGANVATGRTFGFSLGARELDDVLRSITGTVVVDMQDPAAVLLDAPPDVMAAAGSVRRAHLSLGFSSQGMAVRAGELESDLGGLTIERGRVAWGARNLPWYQGLALDLDIALAFQDLAPLAALFGRGDIRGALSGTVALRGPALRPTGSFRLGGDDLSIFGMRVGRLALEGSADQQRLQVQHLELDGELGQATASGNYDYASESLSSARLSARTGALDVLTEGRVSASLAVIEASANGPVRDPAVWADVRAWNIEADGRELEDLAVEGVYDAPCARIDRLTATAGGVGLEAAGEVCHVLGSTTWHVALDRARLSRALLDLALESPVEVELTRDSVAVSQLCVAGTAGRAIGGFAWTPAELSFSIEASELYPMHLLAPFLPEGVVIEGVHGSIDFRKSPEVFSIQAALNVDDLRPFPGSPQAALAFHAQLQGRELILSHFSVRAPEHYEIAVSGRLPTDPRARQWLAEGPLELVGEASVTDLSSLPWELAGLPDQWTGGASARFQLGGTSSEVTGEVDAGLEVTSAPPGFMPIPIHLGAFEFVGRLGLSDKLRIARARITLPEGANALVDGWIDVQVNPKAWLDGERIDWKSRGIDFVAQLGAADLSFLADWSPILRRTSGQLSGELQLGGTLGAPVAKGSLDLIQGEVRLNNALAAFEDLTAHIEFDEQGVRVDPLTGDYGAAPFTANGRIDLTGDEPLLDFQLGGRGLLLAREEGFRLRADADLTLKGSLDALELGGELVIVEGRFSREFPLLSLPGSSAGRSVREFELPFLRQAPWASTEFDVNLTARKPIRVETNIARGTVEPRLHLSGNGAAPHLSGTLMVGSTRVKLPAASMEVTSGVLTFRGSGSLMPDLDITATTRLRGYDITAQVSGTSAEPEVLFTSSPPLSSEELAILVLTGQLPESALSGPGGGAAAQTVAVYLGRDILTRWLGVDGDDDDPLSERFEFYRGAEVSQTGIESTEFIFRLTSNPQGKSRIVYLRAEKDIYERINFGVKFLFRFQ